MMKTALMSLDREQRVPYSQLRSQLATGDLVLFSGNNWSSRIVKYFTFSRWSHIGVVVRLPELGDQPLLWEATRASKLNDIWHGSVVDGFQLVPLDEKVASYAGTMAIRQLQHSLPESERLSLLRELLRQWNTKPYRNYVQKNLAAWLWGDEAVAISASGGFCSEMVAEIYKRWRLLPAERPARYYVPRHFGFRTEFPALVGCLSATCWLHR